MSINQRQHIRFSLDIPATLVTKFGYRHRTVLQQISVGGCFTDWQEDILTGDEFRLELTLPTGNRMPVQCKAVYCFDQAGIGVKFLDISKFEQSLISKLITSTLEAEGLPVRVDPFEPPRSFDDEKPEPRMADRHRDRDEMLDSIMSSPDQPAH